MSWVLKGSAETGGPLKGSKGPGCHRALIGLFFSEKCHADGVVGAEGWNNTCASSGSPPYLGRDREHQHLELLAAFMAGGMANSDSSG